MPEERSSYTYNGLSLTLKDSRYKQVKDFSDSEGMKQKKLIQNLISVVIAESSASDMERWLKKTKAAAEVAKQLELVRQAQAAAAKAQAAAEEAARQQAAAEEALKAFQS